MENTTFHVQLRGFQIAGFRDVQAVLEQEQDRAAVTGFIPHPLTASRRLSTSNAVRCLRSSIIIVQCFCLTTH